MIIYFKIKKTEETILYYFNLSYIILTDLKIITIFISSNNFE